MNKYLINTKSIEDLKPEHKMILSIKGALKEIESNPEQEPFFAAFIVSTIDKLKTEYGMTKDEIFKYKFNFI